MARAFCLLRVKPFDFADLSALRFSSIRTVEGLFLFGDKMKSKKETIEKIAKDVLGLKTLKTRNSDSLDFSDQSVWAIKEALEKAYDAGRKAGAK